MREWIVTNGLGGYASLTHTHETTSKFHGLLIASLEPPTKRWVFVSNVMDTIKINDRTISRQNLPGRFSFDFFPSLTYAAEGFTLKKTFLMDHEKNTTVIKYSVQTEKPLTLVHSPVINSRHFYDTTNPGMVSFSEQVTDQGVVIKPSNVDRRLAILLHGAPYSTDGYWEEWYYQKDRERRDAWRDHNFHIGDFTKSITGPTEYYLICTLEDDLRIDPLKVYARELQRKKDLLAQAHLPHEADKLVLSADSFLVKKGTGESVVAGYHWFSDWGRDTLISLPGITLVTKRFRDAKQILEGFGRYCKNGLIPNVFLERNAEPAYNTVDASLWYIDRVYQYLAYTNDQAFLKTLWPTLTAIIQGYLHGTAYGIHMDKDFLISHGPGLTWMDVKIGDYYPTPRSKKAVEIQGLWYNALMIMSTFSRILDKKDEYANLALQVKENFLPQYDQQYDVIDTKDASVRPNQIFLVSLDYTMIEQKTQEKIVDDVLKELLTVFGLRTLSPNDPGYKGTYFGDYNKDAAYHNGTVWPWLLGPLITAFVKVKHHEEAWRRYAFHHFLHPMLEVFGDDWDGTVHEIFDGNFPFSPQGCITQAWSVAEILRALVEDIEDAQPPYKKTLLHEVRV